VAHLPVVKAYARRMGLVEVVDRALVSGMRVSPGKVLLGLVMNVLCGRSPLYRVGGFFSDARRVVAFGRGNDRRDAQR